jgi:integrase
MLRQLELVPTLPTIRLGLRLIPLTMVRKSELREAVWDEVDFENAVWSIPKERMKRGNPRRVMVIVSALTLPNSASRRSFTSMTRTPTSGRIAIRSG